MRPAPLIVAGLLAVTLVPTVAAVEFPFGSTVAGADYDLTPIAETQRVALCYIDFNGDATPSADEPIFLMTRITTNGVCPANLGFVSILLNNVPGRAAGMEVNGADPWAVKAVRTLTDLHAVRYVEDGSDVSKLDGKDQVYIDVKNVAALRVDVGDLRLTASGPYKAGSLVAAGDADLNRPLSEIRGATRQVHSANVVYKAASGFYVNADAGALGGSITCAAVPCTVAVTGDYGVESGDIRLNPKAVNPLTDTALVLPDHVELVQANVAPGQPFQVKVTMKNTGKATGAGLVETLVDDVVVDGRGTPSIEPNGVAVLTLTLLAPVTPGQHIVKVGTYADFLEVSGAPATSAATFEGELADVETRLQALEAGRGKTVKASGAPGLGPVVALGALAAVTMLLRRRQA